MNHSNPRAALVVVGQGYVGLPLAMRAVEAGFDVVGFDVDERRVKRCSSGDSYVEDITDERARARRCATGRYRAHRPTPPTAPASTSPSSPCRRRCARAPRT